MKNRKKYREFGGEEYHHSEHVAGFKKMGSLRPKPLVDLKLKLSENS